MDLSRRARTALLYAVLSGALVLGMAGTAAAFADRSKPAPTSAAFTVATTPRVAPTGPAVTPTVATPAVPVPDPAARQALARPDSRTTPRPTSGPTPTAPATPPAAVVASAAALPPVDAVVVGSVVTP